jgi:putative tricarboxylic transport membrane protein
MATYYKQRLIEGTIIVGIGVTLIVLTPLAVAEAHAMLRQQLSPRFIPTLVGIGLVLTGAALFVLAFFGRVKEQPAQFSREGTIRVVSAFLLLVAYGYLFTIVGFVVTSAVFLALFAYLFGARSIPKVAAITVVCPIAVWLVFERVFNVPLPGGFLF